MTAGASPSLHLFSTVLFMLVLSAVSLTAQDGTSVFEARLRQAGKNRAQIEKALQKVAKDQKEGMRFLVEHMPERDLKTLTADYLLENVAFAYKAWREAPWHKAVPKQIFLNEILPYASINERRDAWRKDFYNRFAKRAASAKTPGAAAALLNRTIFKELKVKYSTKRPKPDQSPYESMSAGLASCSGLSVLLIDACRAVGVPARFVGTPLWSDGSGNHSWVEVWDQGWHFTGAAEPTGEELDRGWFIGRASKALRGDQLRAIYATSFRRTPQVFPLVWDKNIRYVHAVNVTDRYTSRGMTIPEGKGRVRFCVTGPEGDRLAVTVTVSDAAGKRVFSGMTNDERFDANDHLTAVLKLRDDHVMTFVAPDGRSFTKRFSPAADEYLLRFTIPSDNRGDKK